MNATQITTTTSIDWTHARDLSRRVAAAMMAGSRNGATDAEDIAQKVSYELYRNSQEGFVPESLDAVVRNMTRQRVWDQWTRNGRIRLREGLSIDEEVEAGNEPASATPTPEDLAVAQQNRERIARSLREFARRDPKPARLWVARNVNGESSEVLGKRENMSKSAVDVAIFRAGAKLRRVAASLEASRAAPNASARPDAIGRLLDTLLWVSSKIKRACGRLVNGLKVLIGARA